VGNNPVFTNYGITSSVPNNISQIYGFASNLVENQIWFYVIGERIFLLSNTYFVLLCVSATPM